MDHLQSASGTLSVHFRSHGGGEGKTPHERNRITHTKFLEAELARVETEFQKAAEERETLDLSSEFGLILEVVSEPGFALEFDSLEDGTQGKPPIVLLNVRKKQTPSGEVTKASIFVPFGRLDALGTKVAAYSDPSKDTRNKKGKITGPKNNKLLANIASISVAAFEALWTDPEQPPSPSNELWFELWVRRSSVDWENQLRVECTQVGIAVPDLKLVLPEHIILVVKATRAQLESSLDLLNTLSEIRIARPCSVGLTDLSGSEQYEWLDDALSRINWPGDEAPAVCLIDSGVNRAHPLIEPILSTKDCESIFSDGDTSDDMKHGTPMAGLAAFGDLRELMLSSGSWEQLHRLESVKLLRESTNHNPENYGAITLQAITLPGIAAPNRSRVFCMAVTVPGPNTGGNPSAWSSAIDQMAAGAETDDSTPKLILLSAGNIREHLEEFVYPDSIEAAPVEDPAQAWNAVTVGAITTRSIEEDFDEAQRSVEVAPEYGLSPFTRTSLEWREDWPISPEIVMEGGNLAHGSDGSFSHLDSLQPLSSATQFGVRPLAPFNATSAATALAARVAAKIATRYPHYSAETLRGLLVHSARWPEAVLEREKFDPHVSGNTVKVESLVRRYGYGILNEKRALDSLSNQTTLICERIIQPYHGKWNDTKLNECHLHALPWPRDILAESPDTPVTLRVTLSYFIEPNPGSRTWEKSKKYHYASCLLRFRPKHRDMSVEEFQRRLDAEGNKPSKDTFTDNGWALGGNRRGKCGSLVQDVWKGTAAQLADMGQIAVIPAKGWWAYRNFKPGHYLHGRHTRSVPYSLILSIEADGELPIYNAVSTAIAAAIPAAEISVDS